LGVEPSNCRHSVTCRTRRYLITFGLAFASPSIAWLSYWFIEPTMSQRVLPPVGGCHLYLLASPKQKG
jgi:hypothetical protein